MNCWSLEGYMCCVQMHCQFKLKAQGPDTLCDTSDWGSNSIITEEDTGVYERKAADE